MSNDTVGADAPTSLEASRDEYLRLQVAKIVADVRFEEAEKKMQAQAAAKAAEDAATSPTTPVDYRHKFFELDESLHDAVVWTSLLGKIVDDMPSMSSREADIAVSQLSRVIDGLKEAIEHLDTIYHQRTKQEEQT